MIIPDFGADLSVSLLRLDHATIVSESCNNLVGKLVIAGKS